MYIQSLQNVCDCCCRSSEWKNIPSKERDKMNIKVDDDGNFWCVAHTHTHTHTHPHTHTHARMHARMDIHMHIHTNKQTHTHKHTLYKNHACVHDLCGIQDGAT